MQITQQMIDAAKRYACQNEDLYTHFAPDGYEPEDYIGFWHEGEYILNPWTECSKEPIGDPFETFGRSNMENLIVELLAKNEVLRLMNANCPVGWLYIGDNGIGKERYALGELGNRNLICFGVNPSTAVPGQDDRTISIVKNVAKNNGYDGWIMLNLYPLRYTVPARIPKRKSKSIMKKNSMIINGLLSRYPDAPLWAAWGNNIDNRGYLRELLLNNRETLGKRKWYCRGRLSKAGHPHHPLYVSKNERFVSFNFEKYSEQL